MSQTTSSPPNAQAPTHRDLADQDLADRDRTSPDGAAVVSFDDEPLILVDGDDEVVGYMPKAQAHEGDGVLHRAFSVFVFDDQGRVLMQQRSETKPLWPLYWSNSCCSHPRRGERMEAAVERRLQEELGLEATVGEDVRFVYKFQYHARYRDIGSEHELCSVFVGRADGEVSTNPTEVAAWHFLAPDELDRRVADHPERYSPWFKLEWARLRESCWSEVEAAISRS